MAAPKLQVGTVFTVNGPVILHHMQPNDKFCIVDVHDWRTVHTYNVKRCDETGRVLKIARDHMFWSTIIDDLLQDGKLVTN